MNFEHFTADVRTQTIYLDRSGHLQNSCDSIFSTTGWQRDTMLARFPLLKSIFIRLTNLHVDSPPIHIPKVESATGLPNGFYDFSFVCLHINKKEFIRWVIYDYTKKYSRLQETQQSQHNTFIANDKKL